MKRERVKDIATVAHRWANGIGESGQASNLFFEGENIYSYGYHFLIARHVYNSRGGHAVLVTQKTYSRSTSAQATLVRQASRHIQQIGVPDPEFDAEMMFEEWYNQIKLIAGRLEYSRKPEKLVWEIGRVYAAAESYAAFFAIDIPAALRQAGTIDDSEQYREMVRQETELKDAQLKKKRIEALRIQKINLKRWRSFKADYLTTADGFDYLRYNTATRRIETSQRVEIPEAIGRQFYAVVLDTLAAGGCTDCNLRLMDSYEVRSINAKFIQVGCHKISLKEIRSFTKKQGW
ncbi:hypothetical protein [Mucilaginibacter ginsenosidivorax]|uniref:Uncharacterized protein n=1 Tax=Mucilaginibacter ginsenosidivorax TaxID=862126 RepID=A0A5B8W8L5_9SPHI|nr:hypothetical protein [Mucilaginibacter ginsenosidivorax]QEC78588.1 hypothetical protein FSB76_22535 [Mucilaginibacter ginsenosidivorax]